MNSYFKWFVILFVLGSVACAHQKMKTVLDNEGIEDDENHPRTVEALREEIRARRDLATATEMLKQVYALRIDETGDRETDEYNKRHADAMFKSADGAWDEYQGRETEFETELFCGDGPGGFPKQETNAFRNMQLMRERIDHIRNVLGILSSYDMGDAQKAAIDSKLRELDKIQADWRERMSENQLFSF